MNPNGSSNYSILDCPEILSAIFHPRPEWGNTSDQDAINIHQIEVGQDTFIGARFHIADPESPTILFFHGNGEIVSDYDEIAPLYIERGLNFFVVDYRGYGRSTGTPTVSAMMTDCHTVFHYVRNWLEKNSFNAPLTVMGRSLGSASALELAAHHPDRMDALVIESGFAYAAPLLELLGVNIERIGFKEENGFRNIDKIAAFGGPTLVIHAEYDHIIPFSDGQALFERSRAEKKQFLKIDGADHNDLFFRGMNQYLEAISYLVSAIKSK